MQGIQLTFELFNELGPLNKLRFFLVKLSVFLTANLLLIVQ